MQTKKESFTEASISVLLGYISAIISQLLIFPLVGIEVTLLTNLEIGLYFTIVSLIRSYLLRRYFNYRSQQKLKEN